MKKTRNINLDLIKVIACIGVVLLHTMMPGQGLRKQGDGITHLIYII